MEKCTNPISQGTKAQGVGPGGSSAFGWIEMCLPERAVVNEGTSFNHNRFLQVHILFSTSLLAAWNEVLFRACTCMYTDPKEVGSGRVSRTAVGGPKMRQ